MKNEGDTGAEPEMKRLGASIRSLREDLGLSQAKVANLAGTTQQTVDRIERGAVQWSRHYQSILAALSSASDSMIDKLPPSERDRVRQELGASGVVAQMPYDPEIIPVYAYNNMEVLSELEPIIQIPRPHILAHVRDAYALLIQDDHLIPIFRAGDIALVNPHIPPRQWNDVVLVRRSLTGDVTRRIGTLVRETATDRSIATWIPFEEETLNQEIWPDCHVIVGKFART